MEQERVGIQGDRGSYSHSVVLDRAPDAEHVHYKKFGQAFDALDTGEVDRLWVPIENTRAGFINDPYRRLTGHETMGDYWIDQEYRLPVRHGLLVNPGATKEGLRIIESQGEALRQCPAFLTTMNGQIEVRQGSDTAESARKVAESGRLDYAAIAGVPAAIEYGLDVLESNIQDDDINLTRFVSVTRIENREVRDVNPNVTSAVLTLANQEEGALRDALDVMVHHGINLRYINSQHIPNSPLEVDILTEMEIGLLDERMEQVVRDLASVKTTMTPIGTYEAHSLPDDMTAQSSTREMSVDPAEATAEYRELVSRLKVSV